MQIEFYLPLPTDGFWSALIIYYTLGLLVVAGYVIYADSISGWDGKPIGKPEVIKEIGIISLLALIFPLVIWAFWCQSKYKGQ